MIRRLSSTAWKSSVAVLVAVAALVVLAACSRAKSSSSRVVISYWEKWSGFEADAMRAIVGDFNRAQDRIEVRYLSIPEVDVKLLLATSSGRPPDLAGLWSFSIPDFAEKGALTPLDRAIGEAGLQGDRYIPKYWELCRHRGFTWGLPTTPGCVALFYNKKLFREAGLDPERPPRTFAELNAMNRRLTLVELMRDSQRVRVSFDQLTDAERAERRFALIRVGHLPRDAGMWHSAWPYWFGAELYDGDRRILAEHPGCVAAFEWLQEAAELYGVENLRRFTAGFGLQQSAQSPFLGGASAMVLQGPWMRNFIENYAPGLEWGVAPFPPAVESAGGAPVTLIEADVIVIPRGAPHPREAFEFIAYLQRQDVAEKLATAQRKFTALREVSPGFFATHPNPAIATFVELARSPAAKSVPRLSIWREYNTEMTVAIENVVNLRATPAAALAKVQERVQWRFDRVLRRWDAVREERLAEWREHDHAW